MAKGTFQLKIGSKPAELATLLLRLSRSLDVLIGNSDRHRQLWMSTHSQAFNQAPKDMIERVEGLAMVVRYLDGARAIR